MALRYVSITLYCISVCCILIAFHYIVLCCIALCCITLYCIASYCIMLHYIPPHCTVLHYIILQCIILHYIILHCITLHCILCVYCIVSRVSLYQLRLPEGTDAMFQLDVGRREEQCRQFRQWFQRRVSFYTHKASIHRSKRKNRGCVGNRGMKTVYFGLSSFRFKSHHRQSPFPLLLITRWWTEWQVLQTDAVKNWGPRHCGWCCGSEGSWETFQPNSENIFTSAGDPLLG